MAFEKISLLVIVGEKKLNSSEDKKFVEVGGVKILENILQKAAKENFAEIFLCAERETVPLQILSWKYEAKILVGKVKNFEPAALLANGLAKIKTKWALAISADMPFFDFEILKSAENFSRYKAIIPAVNKKIYPLAAFYHKSLAKFFSEEIQNNQPNIFDAIKKIPHKILKLSDCEKIFFKIKNRADLRLAQGRVENLSRKIPVISVVASTPNPSKTTFIEKLIQKLSEENISVGVIKGDVNDVNFSANDSASQNFQNVGAKSVAVVSQNGWFMFQKTESRENFLSVAEKMNGVDLILTDSRTQYYQPAFSLWFGEDDIIRDKNIAAIFLTQPQSSEDILQFDLNDIDSAVKLCKFLTS